MKITVQINTEKIARSRGLDNGGAKLRKYVAGRVRHYCDKYVPMQSGTLKNTAKISTDGDAVLYEQPYAHYQYYGQVMGGRAPKHYTGNALDYHEAPMRGAQWDKRMLIDSHEDIEKDAAAYIGGGGK